jgi:hypothetical protein
MQLMEKRGRWQLADYFESQKGEHLLQRMKWSPKWGKKCVKVKGKEKEKV